jgi:formamidase
MSRPLPVTAVQAAPVAYDATATYQKFETELATLKTSFPQTRLFVYPELYLSAIAGMATAFPKGYDASVAEPIPGPLTDRLCKLAEKLEVWLVPGSIYEKGEEGRIYNTAVAISPSGDIVARYRKLFPWQPWERTSHGNEFVVFDLDGIGRAGLMICYDGWFPEVSRHLAWKGAEVILQPTATATTDRAQELVLARANAIVNQVYVVNPNMGGRPGPGRSIIVDPEGMPCRWAATARVPHRGPRPGRGDAGPRVRLGRAQPDVGPARTRGSRDRPADVRRDLPASSEASGVSAAARTRATRAPLRRFRCSTSGTYGSASGCWMGPSTP